MKNNKIIVSTIAITLGAMLTSVAFAEEYAVPLQVKGSLGTQVDTSTTNTNLDADADVNASASAGTKADDSNMAEVKNTTSVSTEANENDTDAGSRSAMSDTHRSAVATFVQSLLKVADREGGIGAQVRVIAQAQNDSEKTTAEAIAKVENRNGFVTFFIGTDYKNIGVLRSEMVTTSNQIDQLKKLVAQVTNSTDKAELQAQIQVLEQEQVKIQTFITTHENRFSLLGWLFR